MAGEHEVGLRGLLYIFNGLPEPAGLTLPREDWATASGPGSANIPLMKAVAKYVYDLMRGVRGAARDRMLSYHRVSKTRYMLSEPLGVIYPGWTVGSWVVAAHFARKYKDVQVEAAFVDLLTQWWVLCRMAEAKCPPGGAEKNAFAIGKLILAFCGCRSWGHDLGLGFSQHELWRVAKGQLPAKRGKPYDSFAQAILWECLELIRSTARPVIDAPTIADAVKLCSQYPLRTDFEFRRYADGSVAVSMGKDEVEYVDEDPNSNTPATMLMVVDQTKQFIESYPEHPHPVTGLSRIRQTGVFADLDYLPPHPGDDTGLWVLRHSHVGRVKVGEYWETEILEPEAPLVEHWVIPRDRQGWVNVFAEPAFEQPEYKPWQPEFERAFAPAPGMVKLTDWFINADNGLGGKMATGEVFGISRVEGTDFFVLRKGGGRQPWSTETLVFDAERGGIFLLTEASYSYDVVSEKMVLDYVRNFFDDGMRPGILWLPLDIPANNTLKKYTTSGWLHERRMNDGSTPYLPADAKAEALLPGQYRTKRVVAYTTVQHLGRVTRGNMQVGAIRRTDRMGANQEKVEDYEVVFNDAAIGYGDWEAWESGVRKGAVSLQELVSLGGGCELFSMSPDGSEGWWSTPGIPVMVPVLEPAPRPEPPREKKSWWQRLLEWLGL